MRVIAAIVLCALLAACSGGSDSPETAEEAAVRQYEMYAKEQYGRFYDELHPAAQDAQSRDDYMEEAGEELFSIRSVRAVESYDEEFKFPDGTRTVTAVTLEFTTGLGALPSDGEKQTITVYEELIDGKWRLFKN